MDAIDNLEMNSLKHTEEAAPSAPTTKECKYGISTIAIGIARPSCGPRE
jgi:hypothetical protein